MSERGKYVWELTSEQISQELRDYLHDAEFGSAKHQAMYDYHEHEHRLHILENRVEKASNPKNNLKEKVSSESQLRIAEQHVVMIERDMERKKTSVPGYESALTFISIRFEELYQLLPYERQRLQKDEFYETRTFGSVLSDAYYLLLDRFEVTWE